MHGHTNIKFMALDSAAREYFSHMYLQNTSWLEVI